MPPAPSPTWRLLGPSLSQHLPPYGASCEPALVCLQGGGSAAGRDAELGGLHPGKEHHGEPQGAEAVAPGGCQGLHRKRQVRLGSRRPLTVGGHVGTTVRGEAHPSPGALWPGSSPAPCSDPQSTPRVPGSVSGWTGMGPRNRERRVVWGHSVTAREEPVQALQSRPGPPPPAPL